MLTSHNSPQHKVFVECKGKKSYNKLKSYCNRRYLYGLDWNRHNVLSLLHSLSNKLSQNNTQENSHHKNASAAHLNNEHYQNTLNAGLIEMTNAVNNTASNDQGVL